MRIPLYQRFASVLLAVVLLPIAVRAQSVSLPTDRARVTVASIPDAYNPGGPALKVLRTDTGTPLRAGTAWIWEKDRQEEPESYYTAMAAKGLNAVRMILFDTWEVETYPPAATFTPTDWNDSAYRTRQLARMERAIDYASAHGLYVIINSHDHIPSYDETYATALWTVVAPYFANRTHVLFEASNEPMDGIGNNGSMTPNASDSALNSPRLQALKRVYNVMRNGAPSTHIMILTSSSPRSRVPAGRWPTHPTATHDPGRAPAGDDPGAASRPGLFADGDALSSVATSRTSTGRCGHLPL